jgi:hypothetical protein
VFQNACVSYTWAPSVDDSGDPLVPQLGTLVFPANSFDLRQERGNFSFDVTNRLVANYGLPLPFGRGTSRINPGFVGRVLEGWTVSGITTLQSGFPFDVVSTRDSQGTGSAQQADYNPHLTPASLAAGVSPITQAGPNAGLFFEPQLFPRAGRRPMEFGCCGEHEDQRSLYAGASHRCPQPVQPSGLGQPDNVIEDGPGVFGQSFNQVAQNDSTTGARQLQVGLKLHF